MITICNFHHRIFMTRKNHPAFIILIFSFLLPMIDVIADPGDGLIIIGTNVNLRSKPSLDSEVFLKFNKGKEVLEISRTLDWIKVATKREDYSAGWIHESLLKPFNGESNRLDSEIVAFNRFKLEYEKLIENIILEKGSNPFTAVENTERGQITFIATNDWFTYAQTDREKILSDIFNLWLKQVDVGISVMVEVVDNNYIQHMVMFR
jgi:hypothetical protein